MRVLGVNCAPAIARLPLPFPAGASALINGEGAATTVNPEGSTNKLPGVLNKRCFGPEALKVGMASTAMYGVGGGYGLRLLISAAEPSMSTLRPGVSALPDSSKPTPVAAMVVFTPSRIGDPST